MAVAAMSALSFAAAASAVAAVHRPSVSTCQNDYGFDCERFVYSMRGRDVIALSWVTMLHFAARSQSHTSHQPYHACTQRH